MNHKIRSDSIRTRISRRNCLCVNWHYNIGRLATPHTILANLIDTHSNRTITHTVNDKRNNDRFLMQVAESLFCGSYHADLKARLGLVQFGSIMSDLLSTVVIWGQVASRTIGPMKTVPGEPPSILMCKSLGKSTCTKIRLLNLYILRVLSIRKGFSVRKMCNYYLKKKH